MDSPLLLVGTGFMGKEYAKVLKGMSIPFTAIGRGDAHAKDFEEAAGIPAVRGGLEKYLASNPQLPHTAIVCTNENQLAPSANTLMKQGVRSLLLEKPGGLNRADIESVEKTAQATGAQVFIAYNRRFYASTRKLQEFMKEDGGAVSFHFEFTEWVHRIPDELKNSPTGRHWFLANSTHLIDLAFFICGEPRELNCIAAGGFDWLDGPARFVGSGTSVQGSLFSYHATWDSAGRWWVEVLTTKRKLILRPLETLKIQMKGTVTEEDVPLNDEYDAKFKPGVYRQVESFLGDKRDLPTVADQVKALAVYEKINGGSAL